MNDIEKYIREHATEFDTATPAEGHEARFLARLAVTPLPQEAPRKAARGFAARFRAAWIPALVCAAVAAALLLIRPGDPFRRAGNDPEAIYYAYMEEVSRIYQEIPCGDSAGRDDALRDITEEEDPFFAQLPEELAPRKRARILRSYYGGLLAQAQKVNEHYCL